MKNLTNKTYTYLVKTVFGSFERFNELREKKEVPKEFWIIKDALGILNIPEETMTYFIDEYVTLRSLPVVEFDKVSEIDGIIVPRDNVVGRKLSTRLSRRKGNPRFIGERLNDAAYSCVLKIRDSYRKELAWHYDEVIEEVEAKCHKRMEEWFEVFFRMNAEQGIVIPEEYLACIKYRKICRGKWDKIRYQSKK